MKTADWLKQPKVKSTEDSALCGVREAARRTGVSEAVLILWLETGKIKPFQTLDAIFGNGQYLFDDAAVERIRQVIDGARTDSNPKLRRVKGATNSDVPKEFYSVAEVAALWNLSTDSIRRLFAEEPGVITLGDGAARRGKRKRVTLRIPKSVLERVHRKPRTSGL
jgi:MerR HTH family regulatory protein